MKKQIIALTIFALLWPSQINAETINLEVSGNGSGSVNQIEESNEQETQVSQSNDSQVVNEIVSSSDTGNNSASDNTADEINVETGDVEQSIEVENHNIGTNIVSSDCQCTDIGTVTNIKISDNSSGSTNTVDTNNSNNAQVSQNNVATITTNVTINANTGDNKVTNNTGSEINVKTGDIYSNTKIENKNVNNNSAIINNQNHGYTIKIAGNGTDSVNKINVNQNNNIVYVSNNLAYISNNINENFNTGGNYIDGNTAAKINLKTGSVKSIIAVANTGINSSSVIISDCNECGGPNNPENPENPQNPENPGSNNGGNNGGSNNGGSNNGGSNSNNDNGVGGPSNGQILGTMLPATGGTLAYIFGANIAMFLTGLYLKLRKFFNTIWSAQFLVTIEIV